MATARIFRKSVIRPVLKKLSLRSDAAEELLGAGQTHYKGSKINAYFAMIASKAMNIVLREPMLCAHP